MALTLNRQNPTKVQELTQAINVIPNNVGLINRLGIFTNEFKSQKNILIPRYTQADALLLDKNWDEKRQTTTGPTRDELSVKIPHHPWQGWITPNDLDGVVSWEDVQNGVELDSLASARVRKMTAARNAIANTLEYSRAYTLTTGQVFAPNGSLRTSYGNTYDWYQEFGVTRDEIPVALTDDNINPLAVLDSVADTITTNYKGGKTIERFIMLCSPSFFDALRYNAYVNDAVKYINFPGVSENMLIGQPNSVPGLSGIYQTFTFGSFTYVRYPGSYAGQAYIPEGDAIAFPVVEGLFRTFYAPEQTFASINNIASEVYWYEEMNAKGDAMLLEAESNFLNFIEDPASVVRVYLDA